MTEKYFFNFQKIKYNQLRWRFTPLIQKKLLKALSIHFDRLVEENACRKNSSKVSFLYHHPLYCPDSVYVKIYPVKQLNSRIRETLRIRHKNYGLRYAPAEAINLIRARKRGLGCPDVYAIGEVRKFFLIGMYVLIMEYLPDYRTLTELLRQSRSETDKLKVLRQTRYVIEEMFAKRIFQSDLNSDNIMLVPGKFEKYKAIDFEYVKYMTKPSQKAVAFQLGYLFRKWCGRYISGEIYDQWARDLLHDLIGKRCLQLWWPTYEKAKTMHISRKINMTMAMGNE